MLLDSKGCWMLLDIDRLELQEIEAWTGSKLLESKSTC